MCAQNRDLTQPTPGLNYQEIPEGMYIIGLRVKTDDPSGSITRLDLLLSEGRETEPEPAEQESEEGALSKETE